MHQEKFENMSEMNDINKNTDANETASDTPLTQQNGGLTGKRSQQKWASMDSCRERRLNKQFDSYLKKARRFAVEPSEKEREDQLTKSAKLLTQVTLPKFNPTNEREAEDWVDGAATTFGKLNFCVDLFYMAWRSVATPEIARRMEDLTLPPTCDELVDSVIRMLFPKSKLWIHMTGELVNPPRQQSVMAARNWFDRNVSRYARIIKRWDLYLPIADEYLAQTFRKCLPTKVAANIELWCKSVDVAKMVLSAVELESSMDVENEEVYAADGERTTNRTKRRQSPSSSGSSPANKSAPAKKRKIKCFCCGEEGHMKFDCPQLDKAVCSNCDKPGHLTVACMAKVRRDASGKIRMVTKESPSKTEVVHKHDRTKKEFAETGRQIADLLHKHFLKRSRRSQREDANVLDKGSDDENTMKDIAESFASFLDANEGKKALEVSVQVNGKKATAMIDTGAAWAICNADFAERFGLRRLGVKRTFEGVGSQEGERCLPAQVQFEHKKCKVVFYVLKKLKRSCILGRIAMKSLQVDPSLKSNKLVHWKESRAEVYESQPVIMHSDSHTGWVDARSTLGVLVSDAELVRKHREVFDKQVGHIKDKPELVERLWQVLLKYKGCWLRPNSGKLTSIKADFNVKGPPIKQSLRYLPREHKELLEQHLKDMLEKKVIQPSKSEWGFVPVFVKKKDGGWRLCLDYRPLNKRLEGDAYPIPLLWPHIQQAAGNKYYICLDCNWGYWNVPLGGESKKYTALVTHKGTFEFNVLPFGIKTSGSVFQRAIDSVIGHLYHKGVLSYIDDIVIFGNSIDELLSLLEEVLKECEAKGLYLKMAKAQWFRPDVKLLGHIVSELGIRANPEKVEEVRKARAPSNRAELRSFLGLASYMRKFVPHYSTIAFPLIELTSPKTPFTWSEEAEESFQALKESICDLVTLNAPKDGEFSIMTDASDYGIGAVLLQKQDDTLVPLEFASYKFKPVERKWSTREREAFAVKWAVTRFHDYVQAGPFTLYTDHENLQWMHKSNKGKVQRWSLFLQQYDMTICYIKGDENAAADWLSRIPADIDDDELIDDISVPHMLVDKVEDHAVKLVDTEFVPVLPTIRQIRKSLDNDSAADWVGSYLGPDGLRRDSRRDKLYIPKDLRQSIMWWFHTSKSGGHFGINGTLRRMRLWIWWPGMHKSVSDYIGACLLCQRKPIPVLRGVRYALSKPYPFELISLDWVGPETINGVEHYYLVIIDHASRFVMADVSLTCDAQVTRDLFERGWCSIFSAPKAVLTDRGAHFRGIFNEFVLNDLGAYHVYSSPYYPQGNAINEACHKSLKRSVVAALWETHNLRAALKDAVKIHNATPHIATGMSPHYMLFGCEMTFPGWQSFRQDGQPRRARYVRNELQFRRLLQERHKQDLGKYDKIPVDKIIVVGDWIVYELSSFESKQVLHPVSSSASFAPHMSLPCKVVAVKDKMLVVAMLGMPHVERDVPISLCRKLKGEIPASLQKIALEQINYEAPRWPASLKVRECTGVPPNKSWDSLVKTRPDLVVGRRH